MALSLNDLKKKKASGQDRNLPPKTPVMPWKDRQGASSGSADRDRIAKSVNERGSIETHESKPNRGRSGDKSKTKKSLGSSVEFEGIPETEPRQLAGGESPFEQGVTPSVASSDATNSEYTEFHKSGDNAESGDVTDMLVNSRTNRRQFDNEESHPLIISETIQGQNGISGTLSETKGRQTEGKTFSDFTIAPSFSRDIVEAETIRGQSEGRPSEHYTSTVVQDKTILESKSNRRQSEDAESSVTGNRPDVEAISSSHPTKMTAKTLGTDSGTNRGQSDDTNSDVVTTSLLGQRNIRGQSEDISSEKDSTMHRRSIKGRLYKTSTVDVSEESLASGSNRGQSGDNSKVLKVQREVANPAGSETIQNLAKDGIFKHLADEDACLDRESQAESNRRQTGDTDSPDLEFQQERFSKTGVESETKKRQSEDNKNRRTDSSNVNTTEDEISETNRGQIGDTSEFDRRFDISDKAISITAEEKTRRLSLPTDAIGRGKDSRNRSDLVKTSSQINSTGSTSNDTDSTWQPELEDPFVLAEINSDQTKGSFRSVGSDLTRLGSSAKTVDYSDYRSLSKLSKDILRVIERNFEDRTSRTTKPMTNSEIALSLGSTVSSVKKTLQRLEAKKCLIRVQFKTGSQGWTIYQIPPSIFIDLIKDKK